MCFATGATKEPCPACNYPVEPVQNFCGDCGNRLPRVDEFPPEGDRVPLIEEVPA